MEQATIPRMRTAPGIVRELKILDPGSEISEHWVRGIIKSGTVPVVRAGCKCLINLDDVLELLRQGTNGQKPKPNSVGGIRRINEKHPK